MPAAAAQRAPKMNQKENRKTVKPENEAKKGFKEKMHDLPRAAGVAIMVALLVLSLFAGNFRALQRATPKDFIRQGDVRSIVEDRIDSAENVLTIARRAGIDDSLITEATHAIRALEDAKTAREISRANQLLTGAVSELAAAQNLGQDETYMLRAADEFAELGSFLRQEARAYNEKAEKAVRLYEKLPAKFMLREPDMYEGI